MANCVDVLPLPTLALTRSVSRMHGSLPLALRARTYPKPKRTRELRSRKRLWARTPRPPVSMLIQCAYGLENKNLTQHASAEMALHRTMPLAWARLSVYGRQDVFVRLRRGISAVEPDRASGAYRTRGVLAWMQW